MDLMTPEEQYPAVYEIAVPRRREGGVRNAVAGGEDEEPGDVSEEGELNANGEAAEQPEDFEAGKVPADAIDIGTGEILEDEETTTDVVVGKHVKEISENYFDTGGRTKGKTKVLHLSPRRVVQIEILSISDEDE